jgi:DNA recombination-dependent growth factor C
MSLLKGALNVTRYRVLDSPEEISNEFLAAHLQKNAFLDIDSTTEEESFGWVEVLNTFSTEFRTDSFNFGPVLMFGLRIDTRRVSNKTVNRYLAMAVAQAEQYSPKPLSNDQKRELKAKVRLELLGRTPVTTDVFEVCWLVGEQELWLVGTGVKVRERFEDQWRRTFGLGLIMKIPYVLAKENLPPNLTPEVLDQVRPAALFGGPRG